MVKATTLRRVKKRKKKAGEIWRKGRGARGVGGEMGNEEVPTSKNGNEREAREADPRPKRP